MDKVKVEIGIRFNQVTKVFELLSSTGKIVGTVELDKTRAGMV